MESGNILLLIVIVIVLYCLYNSYNCNNTEGFYNIINIPPGQYYSYIGSSPLSPFSQNSFDSMKGKLQSCESGYSCPGNPHFDTNQISLDTIDQYNRSTCGLGKYQDEPGQTTCKSCPNNTWTYGGANTHCNSGPYIKPCDSNCQNCGYLEVGGEYACCPHDREPYGGYHYCTGMPNGNVCFSNAMCASGNCWTGKDSSLGSLGTKGVCVSEAPCNPNNGFLDGGYGSAASVIQTIEGKDGAKLTVAAITAIDNIIGSL